MDKTYKDRLFELIYVYRKILIWKRDEKSNYTDYECEIGGLTLRVVSAEYEYLQVVSNCTDYRCYDAKDYPRVREILEVAHEQWVAQKDDIFFKDAFVKLSYALGKKESDN